MRGTRVVGFDLDNTLYDQAQHMLSFFRAAASVVAERCTLPAGQIEQAFIAVWTRRTSYYGKLFDEALETLGLDDRTLVKQLVTLYHEHDAQLALFDGVRDMLGRLRGHCTLFMITDGNPLMQQRKISSLQLADYFAEIVVTGSFGREWAKPAIHAYRHVLERLGGDPGEYLYIGDNPHCDFYGARQLGMRTARVRSGPFADQEGPESTYAADVTIERATDVERLL